MRIMSRVLGGWQHGRDPGDGLFPKLEALNAHTDTEVTGYRALVSGDLGYGVLDFRQSLIVGGLVATFDCIATIIWKKTATGWKESRWHCSVISSSIPSEIADS